MPMVLYKKHFIIEQFRAINNKYSCLSILSVLVKKTFKFEI